MSNDGSMSFIDHLAELRRTLLWSIVFAMAATVVAWFFSDQIVDSLLRPARIAGQDTLYFQAPMEAFLLKLKASLAVGVMAVFPLILYRVYMFVMPGLLPREKRVVTPLLTTATILFYVGVTFCFVVLLPMIIRFAMSFATEGLQPWLTAGAYFEMAWRLCLAFGLFFELPIVVFVLSWVGVVHPRTLLRGWRYALVLILVASAGFTPPDIISQVLLGGPVMLLYMGSVLVSLVVRKRKDKARAAEEEQDEGDDDPPEGDGPEDDGPDEGGPGGGPRRGGDSSSGAPTGDAEAGSGDSREEELVWDVPPVPRPAEGAQPRAPRSGGSVTEKPGDRARDEGEEAPESRPRRQDPDESN